MRSAFSLQVSATVVLCHVKLMSGGLSLEVREQMLCSGLCNSAATSIVYLFISFLGSEVYVETRCIEHGVNIHILICTLNVREEDVLNDEDANATVQVHVVFATLAAW